MTAHKGAGTPRCSFCKSTEITRVIGEHRLCSKHEHLTDVASASNEDAEAYMARRQKWQERYPSPQV